MTTVRTVRVIALLLSLTVCVLGQTQQPAVRTGAAEAGTITGRVVNENGQPLAGASVQVHAVGGSGRGQIATTNREGEFRVSGLDRASYSVLAFMASYTPEPRDISSTQSQTYHIGDSVTLTLIKGGVITGTVTNANGDPVVAINVRVQMTRDANGKRSSSGFSYEKPTDDRGVYRVYGLAPGTYVVSAGGPNNYSGRETSAFDTDVPTYAPSATRETATEVSVRSGDEATGIDIRYRGEQGRTISGVVNVPNDGAFNVILSTTGDGVVPWTTNYYQAPGARSFVFNGIADGNYQLLAMSYPGSGGRLLAAVAKQISVHGADVSGIELTPVPLATISGRVVLDEPNIPECVDKQRPQFNEILLSAWHRDNDAAKETPQTLWSIGAPVTADGDGNFMLRNLAGGEYYFATRFTAKYWYLQSIAFPAPAATGAKTPGKDASVWTKVNTGDRLSGLTVTLALGAGSLRGDVVTEARSIPEKLFVYLVPSEAEKADVGLRYYAAPVAADGKIAIHNIAPGRYWILAQPFTEDAATPLTKLRQPDGGESRARLRRDAEAAKTEVEFKPCQNVVDFHLPLKP